MKRIVCIFCVLLLSSLCLQFGNIMDSKADDNTQKSVSAIWVADELKFETLKEYINPFMECSLDCVFTHVGSGNTLSIPCFWDGGSSWKCRYALTKIGTWNYVTYCDDIESGMDGLKGEIECVPYTGELEIYKKGFIKTQKNVKYFMYDDGTPFFYLGDTHWFMPREDNTSDTSMFKSIIDKRVLQGFTVYQSEPLDASYNLVNGMSEDDIIGWKDLDQRFKYIAQKGLVHANSQLFHTAILATDPNHGYSDEYLEKLVRYWVARYSAFPVLWTVGQESDNDFYFERGDSVFDASSNPWLNVARWINKYDPYAHPLSAHMEHTSFSDCDDSSFDAIDGHTWFAAQFSFNYSDKPPYDILKSFWNNKKGKVSINYEGLYDHLWTYTKGSRAQGYIAYLSGMYGYGYGAQGIWDSWYNPETTYDGFDAITEKDKQVSWQEALEFESGYQMTYLKSFMNENSWWQLVPRFDDDKWVSSSFKRMNLSKTAYITDHNSQFCLATKGNDLYVIYLYNQNDRGVTLKNLTNTRYTFSWYNPRTNEYSDEKSVIIWNGEYSIEAKPDNEDWVFIAKKDGFISNYIIITALLLVLSGITVSVVFSIKKKIKLRPVHRCRLRADRIKLVCSNVIYMIYFTCTNIQGS